MNNLTRIGLVSLAALAFAGCGKDRPEPPATASIDQVAGNDDASFLGKTVSLVGEVGAVRHPRAFELEGGPGIFDREILVLSRSDATVDDQRLAEHERLLVTGEVERITSAEVKREVGWALDPELEAMVEKKPVLIARSIRHLPNKRDDGWFEEGYGRR